MLKKNKETDEKWPQTGSFGKKSPQEEEDARVLHARSLHASHACACSARAWVKKIAHASARARSHDLCLLPQFQSAAFSIRPFGLRLKYEAKQIVYMSLKKLWASWAQGP